MILQIIVRPNSQTYNFLDNSLAIPVSSLEQIEMMRPVNRVLYIPIDSKIERKIIPKLVHYMENCELYVLTNRSFKLPNFETHVVEESPNMFQVIGRIWNNKNDRSFTLKLLIENKKSFGFIFQELMKRCDDAFLYEELVYIERMIYNVNVDMLCHQLSLTLERDYENHY